MTIEPAPAPQESPPQALPSEAPAPNVARRRLRAIFAADVANYGGMVTIDETGTIDALQIVRQLATSGIASHGGWLFGLPGDGVFALFESSVDALVCALSVQTRLAAAPRLSALKLRIGLHLGEVMFRDGLPYGEALVVAARLESLAEPGGILVSASVMDAAAAHVSATFVEGGVRTLKHSPRRITTFHVLPPPRAGAREPAEAPLDRTLAPEPAAKRRAPAFVSSDPPAPAAATRAEGRQDGPPLDDLRLNQLIQLLTVHLGPFAKCLVRRKAAACPQASDLIQVLALEIPRASERQDFVSRAEAIAKGPH
jgi:class 3 adenylate cyclase